MAKMVGVFLFSFFINFGLMAQERVIQYLALGDSYTIGEAVDEGERWPVILVKELTSKGLVVPPPKIIATTGWTTDELLLALKQTDDLLPNYDMVSLLIGVNNQYRGYALDQYEQEFEELLKEAIRLAAGDSSMVFVLSIPDYGVTPFAKEKGLNAETIASELETYNNTARQICQRYAVLFFDITENSLKAKSDTSYLAEDLLHPSGRMYKEWVEIIKNDVLKQISYDE